MDETIENLNVVEWNAIYQNGHIRNMNTKSRNILVTI